MSNLCVKRRPQVMRMPLVLLKGLTLAYLVIHNAPCVWTNLLMVRRKGMIADPGRPKGVAGQLNTVTLSCCSSGNVICGQDAQCPSQAVTCTPHALYENCKVLPQYHMLPASLVPLPVCGLHTSCFVRKLQGVATAAFAAGFPSTLPRL